MSLVSGHRARKRFGQNFLKDEHIIERIVDAVHPQPGDHLVEIGPGQGAITGRLLASGCTLDAIELDRDLVPILLAAHGLKPQFKLHSCDALTFDYESLTTDDKPLRVVGNLPYNISTPLIFKLLENRHVIRDMHFMLQKEVVGRLAASPGSKAWGKLGVMAQYHCEVTDLFEVPPEAFSPRPKVQSAIVRLVPRNEPIATDCDEKTLSTVVRFAFAQRRKTLRNNLKHLLPDEALIALDIDPGARAETLDLPRFIALARAVEQRV